MSERLEDKKGKFFILNWMDGERQWFDTESAAMEVYSKDKNEAIDHQEEFDMAVYQQISEYNNIKN
ncbi:MAG: hypothetical protein ACI9AT_002046 [Ulvibacter sp.]|jgi:hypothetical protein